MWLATAVKGWPCVGISTVIQYLSEKPIQPSVVAGRISAGPNSSTTGVSSSTCLYFSSVNLPSVRPTTPSCEMKKFSSFSGLP